MGFDDDEFEVVDAYKAIMAELISRGDTIKKIDDDDEIHIIIGRVYDDGLIVERHDGTFFRDIIDVTDNGLIISDKEKYKYKRFKMIFKRVPMITTVTDMVFLPWNLVTDIRLKHYHHEMDEGVDPGS